MADVPVGVAVVGFPPVRIHGSAAAVGIGGDIQSVRPGVVGQHLQAVRHALAEDHAHALVVGDLVGVDGADRAEQRIRPARVDGARSGSKACCCSSCDPGDRSASRDTAVRDRRRSRTDAPGRRSTDSCAGGLMPGVGDDQSPRQAPLGTRPATANGLDKWAAPGPTDQVQLRIVVYGGFVFRNV